MNEEDVVTKPRRRPGPSPTDDILGVSLKIVCLLPTSITYDEENKVWVDKTGDEEYMKGRRGRRRGA